MTLCTPKYNVSYRGEFHAAGKPFEINADDAEEMKVHGAIEESTEEKTEKKPGRPKKLD
jgi:hypothetical protein